MSSADVRKVHQVEHLPLPLRVEGPRPADKATDFRSHPRERARIDDLMALVPAGVESALDVGARDGFLSRLLSDRVSQVTALDMEQPTFAFHRVKCVRGDATSLQFDDSTFDLVLCAEVLEHIPAVEQAARELARVSRRFVLIGVPYKQDLRIGRCTCPHCGLVNPPWGHVHSFDESRLQRLFPTLALTKVSYVGTTKARSNAVASHLMDVAGNPFGTYGQDERCLGCGSPIDAPRPRSLSQRIATRAGWLLERISTRLARPQANWIHVLLEKRP